MKDSFSSTFVTFRMLYHSIMLLFAVIFMGLQTLAIVHQVEHGEEHSHDCVVCEIATLTSQVADISAPPTFYTRFIEADFTIYDTPLLLAPVTPQHGRAPPPRGPPYTQA